MWLLISTSFAPPSRAYHDAAHIKKVGTIHKVPKNSLTCSSGCPTASRAGRQAGNAGCVCCGPLHRFAPLAGLKHLAKQNKSAQRHSFEVYTVVTGLLRPEESSRTPFQSLPREMMNRSVVVSLGHSFKSTQTGRWVLQHADVCLHPAHVWYACRTLSRSIDGDAALPARRSWKTVHASRSRADSAGSATRIDAHGTVQGHARLQWSTQH